MNYKSCKSYTLLELIIVVIIVGVLAGLAIPRFQKAVYRAHYVEIFNTVDIIVRAKDIYYAEYGTYEGGYSWDEGNVGDGIDPSTSKIQQDLGIEIPQSCFFRYFIGPTESVPYPRIYFRELPDAWAWYYNYETRIWSEYPSGDGGPARDYFSPPQ